MPTTVGAAARAADVVEKQVRRARVDADTCSLNASLLRRKISSLADFHLRHWKPRSVSLREMQSTYGGLAGWGRTRFQIVDGALHYPDLKHNTFGCVLRRTPILAWALLELLERHPKLPDVDVPVNCRDKPGSELRPRRAPILAFSYTTGRGFSDVPLPDYTYWGLPYADLPPWPAWLKSMEEPQYAWGAKRDSIIWVGSPTNPLRSAFAKCAAAELGSTLVHRMPNKDQMHELAWRCKRGAPGTPCATKPDQWTPLEEQCRHRYILHMPGISDWLEHFKHQLACGSVNIFLGRRPNHRALPDGAAPARAAGVSAPRSFEHFDFSGPLLREGEGFIFVPLSGSGGGACKQLRATLRELDKSPAKAQCIARRGQQLAAELAMPRVYDYMASLLTGASLRQQAGVAKAAAKAERSRRVTKANFFSFVPPAKRPWMEHIFRQWHSDRFNATPLLPPRAEETASGLFH